MILDRLAAIVGGANLLRMPGDIAPYDVDGRQGGGRALAVVRPATSKEVAAVVRAAAECALPLVVQGARTGLVGGGLADGHVVLALDRLNQVLTIDVANRTAEVDAGVLLSTLNAEAGEHGLFFPIDLGADPSIGGKVSANTGGARLLRYGDVRRNVLALEVVLSDEGATIVELGRGLWKDNSGLDIKQLIIGGAGSLGVVTRATLALQPLPGGRVSAMISLAEAETAIELLAALEADFGTLLTAFEGMSRAALDAALAHVPRLSSAFPAGVPAYAVLVEITGGKMLSEAMLEDMLGESLAPWLENPAMGVQDVAIDHRDGLWAVRHAIPEGLRSAGKVVGCDVSLRRGDVMRFRADLARRLVDEASQLRLCDFGHIGDGGMHFNLLWPAEAGPYDAGRGEAARAMIFDAVVKDYGGSFSAEHGIGPINVDYYERLVSAAERSLAGSVQKLIAPYSLGRVDFGKGIAK